MKNSEVAKIVEDIWEDKERHFDRLVDATWDTIFYIAYKRINDQQDAKDIAQDVLLYIYNHIGELKTSHAFNMWMNRIIIGMCQEVIRSKKKQEQVVASSHEMILFTEDKAGKIPDEYVDEKEQNIFLMNKIDELSDKQKEVILLFYYENLTIMQIAQILDCSNDAVKNRLFYARKALRKLLEENKQSDIRFYSFMPFVLLPFLMKKDAKAVCTSDIKMSIMRQWVKESGEIADGKQETADQNKKQSWIVVIVIAAVLFVTVFSVYAYIKNRNPGSKDTAYETIDKDKQKSDENPGALDNDSPLNGNEPDNETGSEDDPNDPAAVGDTLPEEQNQNRETPQTGESGNQDDSNTKKYPAGRKLSQGKPILVVENYELDYSVGTVLTQQQIIEDSRAVAKDANGKRLDIRVSNWETVHSGVPDLFGVYLEAVDDNGKTTGKVAVSIAIVE